MATGEQGKAAAVAFEADGVRVRLTCDRPEIAARLPEVLPPDLRQISLEAEAEEFGLVGDGAGTYTFTRGGSPVSSDLDLEFGLMMLHTQSRIFIALNAPQRIFVHAGAVAIGDRAVIFPGRSFSGKTTLVHALLEAGATYLSDEFAVFDAEASVHPYPTHLSVRVGGDERRSVDAAGLGGPTADSSLPLGAIVVTSYRPDAQWSPREITRGQAALALLDNTVAALERHTEALAVFQRATAGPLRLASDRGDVEPVVADLMSRLG